MMDYDLFPFEFDIKIMKKGGYLQCYPLIAKFEMQFEENDTNT